ncbi:MAG TPA: lactate utilization protein, partial [bacterium]
QMSAEQLDEPGAATPEAATPEVPAPPPVIVDEVLASLRRLRGRTRVRVRAGLLGEAVEAMTAVGFQVARFDSGDGVLGRLREIIPQDARVVYQPCAAGRALRVHEVLRAEGRDIVVLPDDAERVGQNGSWREHLLGAQFGVTGATALVADTGSVALAEELGFGRAASNVPPVHIALALADSVVETILDAAVIARGYAALHLDRPLPRYLSLISGPSKTADIGFQLVPGMHGPRAAHVLIWDHPKGTGTGDDALRTWVLA